jgi:phospholipid-transporting ATPase
MLFTLPQFIAAFFNGYSGQTIFDDIYLTLYNLIFTALPLIVRAVLEQDVNYIFKQKNNYEQFPAVAGKSMMSQNNQLPDKYKVNKYFFRLFPKIYFIGQ